MPEEILIDVDANGGVKIEAVGFVGRSCEDATKSFEDALAGKVRDRTHKMEYDMADTSVGTKASLGRL